jgi:hypothetical protein
MKKDAMSKPKQERAKTKIQNSLPKIEPLPGAVCVQWKRCGKPNCRCARGELHGAYFYHFFYVDGKLRKKYVKKADVSRIKAAVETNKQQQQQSRRELQVAIAAIRQFRWRLHDLLAEY